MQASIFFFYWIILPENIRKYMNISLSYSTLSAMQLKPWTLFDVYLKCHMQWRGLQNRPGQKHEQKQCIVPQSSSLAVCTKHSTGSCLFLRTYTNGPRSDETKNISCTLICSDMDMILQTPHLFCKMVSIKWYFDSLLCSGAEKKPGESQCSRFFVSKLQCIIYI